MRHVPERLRRIHPEVSEACWNRAAGGLAAMGRNKKKKRDGDDRRPRLVLSFDEEKRR